MPFTFIPAVREQVHLIIGLAGASGSGKTFSAFRLARGLAAGRRFAVVDTERGRAKHYAGPEFGFDFDHCDLDAPFTPQRYTEAIESAADAGYPVIIVDSVSHEWYGEGGVLDMADAELSRMGGRDSARLASFIKPKMAHKRFVQTLLQVQAHIILLFRAEPKVEAVKDANGKTQIVAKESLIGYKGWIPVTEKNMPFELTVSLMLTPDQPGIPHPIKLQEQHRPFLPLDQVIGEATGASLLAWAAGGEPPEVAAAKKGTEALRAFWEALPAKSKAILKSRLPDLKTLAEAADIGVPPDPAPAEQPTEAPA